MLRLLQRLRKVLFHIDSRTIYLYSLITGCLTGLVALLFHTVIHYTEIYLFDDWTGPFTWATALVPVIGGVLAGLCIYFFAPEAAGTGVDVFLNSFHENAGKLRKRTSTVKFIASYFTIASGGSAGREGPMALIGGGIGSLIGAMLQVGARARRTLLLAGAAGGLGAIFRAPLGGAITSVEVLYKEDIESDSLIPCIISSVTAYTLFSAFVGFGHNLEFKTTIFHSPVELIFYALLGLICSFSGFVFLKVFTLVPEYIFNKLPIHPALLPALGGLGIGGFLFINPDVVGEGVHVLQRAISGEFQGPWLQVCGTFLTLAALKIVTTTLTIGTGGAGGALIPSLFIGAMIGGAFGTVCHEFFPTLVPETVPYMIVGMAAFFSAVTNASLGALVMVTELTGSYQLLPPLMIVAVISLISSSRWSLYRNQKKNKFSSQAHLWDMNPSLLQNTQIREAFEGDYRKEHIFPNNTSLHALDSWARDTQETDCLIVTMTGEFEGMLSFKDFAKAEDELDEETKNIIVAEDLVSRAPQFIREQDSLLKALHFLTHTDLDKVPIVDDSSGTQQLKGYLRYKDILKYYYSIGLRQEGRPAELKSRLE